VLTLGQIGGGFSFQFSTFALVDIIQPHCALNLCVCHGSVPIYDVVCGVPMGSFHCLGWPSRSVGAATRLGEATRVVRRGLR